MSKSEKCTLYCNRLRCVQSSVRDASGDHLARSGRGQSAVGRVCVLQAEHEEPRPALHKDPNSGGLEPSDIQENPHLRDLAGIQGACQSSIINHAATRNVDDPRPLLDLPKRLVTEKVLRRAEDCR